MIKKIFIDLEFNTKNNKLQYFIYDNNAEKRFYICEIPELGPRPSDFPCNLPVNRLYKEHNLIFLILEKISSHDLIFSRKSKLKELYYRSKKFGVRDGYIPKKLKWLKVRNLKISYKKTNFAIKDLISKKNKLKLSPKTHWNILHQLYFQIELDKHLVFKNGNHATNGVFEIFPNLKKKHDLMRYF
ncbi:MAG: hypothetical protein ACTSRG_17760 [Candidatus Helarchaeota archaeon]